MFVFHLMVEMISNRMSYRPKHKSSYTQKMSTVRGGSDRREMITEMVNS